MTAQLGEKREKCLLNEDGKSLEIRKTVKRAILRSRTMQNFFDHLDKMETPKLESTDYSNPIEEFVERGNEEVGELSNEQDSSHEDRVYEALEQKYRPRTFNELPKPKTPFVEVLPKQFTSQHDGKPVPLVMLAMDQNRKRLIEMITAGTLPEKLTTHALATIKEQNFGEVKQQYAALTSV